jgi:hypothetical protein
MPKTITWKPLFREWPGSIEAKQDPGDIASVDCGTRSSTALEFGEDKAQFTCAHARVDVDVDTGDGPPLSKPELARLVLYLAYAGHTCDCFRGYWKYLYGDKKTFCRAAAIATWRWLERRIGCWNVYPGWFERAPQGEDHRLRGEVVDDGLCSDPRAARRLLRAWRSATKAQWEASIVAGARTDYPVYTLDEYLALDDDDAPTETPIPALPARDGQPQSEAAR